MDLVYIQINCLTLTTSNTNILQELNAPNHLQFPTSQQHKKAHIKIDQKKNHTIYWKKKCKPLYEN
jgi:hypothetical protein